MPSDTLHTDREKQPSLYSISVEEFKRAPAEIERYAPGDKITRANFINFLIYSFAVSRGQSQVQIAFMVWQKLKFGFDYSDVMKNFSKAGGWNALSEIERATFKEQFGKVAKHSDTHPSGDWDAIISEELERLVRLIGDIAPIGGKLDLEKSLKNGGDFKTFSNMFQGALESYFKENII